MNSYLLFFKNEMVSNTAVINYCYYCSKYSIDDEINKLIQFYTLRKKRRGTGQTRRLRTKPFVLQ